MQIYIFFVNGEHSFSKKAFLFTFFLFFHPVFDFFSDIFGCKTKFFFQYLVGSRCPKMVKTIYIAVRYHSEQGRGQSCCESKGRHSARYHLLAIGLVLI